MEKNIFKKLKTFIQLLRLVPIISTTTIAFSVTFASLVYSPTQQLGSLNLVKIIIALLSLASVNAASNILNQITDINEDAKAKPYRPLPKKEITIKKEQLTVIETSEEAEIVKQIELLDKRKTVLEEDYNKTLLKLKEKDDEAKKIYEYENRIYTIALETAE